MLVFGPEMHLVTFVILVIESFFLFYPFIRYLTWPEDRQGSGILYC